LPIQSFSRIWRSSSSCYSAVCSHFAGDGCHGFTFRLLFGAENALRHASGSAEYSVGFVEHYIVPVIYPTELTRSLQFFLGFIVLALNLAIYWVIWRRLRVDRTHETPND